MKIPLYNAPFNRPLILEKVTQSVLLSKFQHLGLYEKDIITRLDEEILIRPVKIKGPTGMLILGAGMGSKIVAHLDDGRKIPVAELKKGESGHIEGIIGGTCLAGTMDTMGLKNDDRITFIRSIPPMEYTVLVDLKKRVKIGEGMASKIWGVTDDNHRTQFSSSGKGKEFLVETILGGKKTNDMVFMHGGIKAGSKIVLEGVKPVDTLKMNPVQMVESPVIVTKNDGLRLILDKAKCKSIIVSLKD